MVWELRRMYIICAFSSGDRAFGSGPESMGSSPIRHSFKTSLKNGVFFCVWERGVVENPIPPS